MSLQTKNSCDIDGISTKLLQKIATELSRPLAHIFNLSLSTGKFPDRLKISRTVPIFKAGRTDLCDNCSHDILLMKLSKMGIRGTALEWFKSYLSDRSQIVDTGGNLSRAVFWVPFYFYVLLMTFTV
jgi:hypothetical protein